jgi:hypothetical protein
MGYRHFTQTQDNQTGSFYVTKGDGLEIFRISLELTSPFGAHFLAWEPSRILVHRVSLQAVFLIAKRY